jgi:anaerobic ribonucleoside-triphosphate reductase activating protein
MSGRIANIVSSFSEIPGVICSSVFMTGCSFNCDGCQNPELQNLNYGQLMTIENVLNIINDNYLSEWVCFLGGEPFFQSEFLYNLCYYIKKPIGIYTGNDFDIVCQKYSDILSLPNVKFLKTGKYDQKLIVKNEFPITSNQHIYLKENDIWSKCLDRNFVSISKLIS